MVYRPTPNTPGRPFVVFRSNDLDVVGINRTRYYGWLLEDERDRPSWRGAPVYGFCRPLVCLALSPVT